MKVVEKVCVFGGNGFIGRAVVSELADKGFEVTVCDRKISSRSTGAKYYYECDLFDVDSINKITKQVDYVFNFAAISDLDKCIDAPYESANVNIMGNINLLLASAKAGVKRFIYASSLYALGDSGGFYGCSKRASELYVEEFNKQMSLPYTIINYGSIFGVGSGPENTIYRLIDAALELGRVQYTGDNISSREYIDVVDAASASVAALDLKYENRRLIVVGEQTILKQDFSRLIAEILSMRFDFNDVAVPETKHYSKTPVRYDLDSSIRFKAGNSRDIASSLHRTIEYVVKQRAEVQP